MLEIQIFDTMTKSESTEQGKYTEELDAQYKLELHRYLSRRLYTSSLEVDDVIQETFLRIIRKGNMDLIQNPRAYLYKVAINVIHELELKNQHRYEIPNQDDEINQMESPTTGVDRIEHLSSLETMLRRLPKTQCDVLIAIKRDGKSYEEIANEMNLSPKTVKRYAFLAVLQCRKLGWC